MLALAQLRIDALFAVLIGTAGVMMMLRAYVALSKRTLAARDAQVIAQIEQHKTERVRASQDTPQ